MAGIKFTHQQIERFSDRIRNCLEDEHCRTVFEQYLRNGDKPALYRTLKLWTKANSTNSFDEDAFFDLIDEIDEFNENPLLTISECEHKLSFIKSECCRILEKIHSHFIEYLIRHHV